MKTYDYTNIISTRSTNTELVNALMNYSRGGVMTQAFILNALEKFATQVVDNREQVTKDMQDSFIAPELWIACAEDVLAGIKARSESEAPVRSAKREREVRDWPLVVRSLFKHLNAASILVDEVDNGEECVKGTFGELLDAACACDEARLLVKIPGHTNRHTIELTFDEQPFDVCSNWSDDPVLDKVLGEWSDSWEGKPMPWRKVPA